MKRAATAIAPVMIAAAITQRGAQNLGTRCVWGVAQTLIVVHDDCDSELEKDAQNIKTAIASVKLCTRPYFVRLGT
jgi:hypothetical protein